MSSVYSSYQLEKKLNVDKPFSEQGLEKGSNIGCSGVTHTTNYYEVSVSGNLRISWPPRRHRGSQRNFLSTRSHIPWSRHLQGTDLQPKINLQLHKLSFQPSRSFPSSLNLALSRSFPSWLNEKNVRQPSCQLLQTRPERLDDRSVIVILGPSISGKSEVYKSLLGDVSEQAMKLTEGIEECTAIIRDIKVAVRAFSGDTRYSGLAELFSVQNALYLLPVDMQEYSINVDSREWFNRNVSCYLRRIPNNQTVFFIGFLGGRKDLLTNLMKVAVATLKNENKVLNIVEYFTTENTTESLELLKDELVRNLLDQKQFPDRGKRRPKWEKAEHALKGKSALWVSTETVKKVLTTNEFSSEEMVIFLRYLHNVGSIIWHGELHHSEDFVCVNPRMLMKAINMIFRKYTKESFSKAYPAHMHAWQMYSTHGCISKKLISWILKEVTNHDIDITMRALEDFKVCRKVEVLTPEENQWTQLLVNVLFLDSTYNDHHATPAQQLTVKLPTWKKLKTVTIYRFPCLLENRENPDDKVLPGCAEIVAE